MSREDIKKRAVKQKGGCCILCGYNATLSGLDFHHINPFEKVKNISEYSSWNAELELELNKCVLVCKNCHSFVHTDMFCHDLWEVLEA